MEAIESPTGFVLLLQRSPAVSLTFSNSGCIEKETVTAQTAQKDRKTQSWLSKPFVLSSHVQPCLCNRPLSLPTSSHIPPGKHLSEPDTKVSGGKKNL